MCLDQEKRQEKERDANSLRGIIGTRLRRSCSANPSNSSVPADSDPTTVRSCQPSLETATSPYTSPPNPPNANTAPGQSRLAAAVGLPLSGTRRTAIHKVAMAINGLIRNIARQDR